MVELAAWHVSPMATKSIWVIDNDRITFLKASRLRHITSQITVG